MLVLGRPHMVYYKNITEVNLLYSDLSIQTDILAALYDKLTTAVICKMHMLQIQTFKTVVTRKPS